MSELNLEEKVTVRSIAGWTTGFKRIESIGDVTIAPKGSTRISRSEIIAQAQSGNKLFTGTDEQGTHATLYIEDEAVRKELGFDYEENGKTHKQHVLNKDTVTKLFNYKRIDSFKENLEKFVVTRAEKYAITQMIKELGLNDFEKIRVVELYTGFRM